MPRRYPVSVFGDGTMMAIVTLSLGKHFEKANNHKVYDKKTGFCPLMVLGEVRAGIIQKSGIFMTQKCTDITGAHHSILVEGEDRNEIDNTICLFLVHHYDAHVTRVEYLGL